MTAIVTKGGARMTVGPAEEPPTNKGSNRNRTGTAKGMTAPAVIPSKFIYWKFSGRPEGRVSLRFYSTLTSCPGQIL